MPKQGMKMQVSLHAHNRHPLRIRYVAGVPLFFAVTLHRQKVKKRPKTHRIIYLTFKSPLKRQWDVEVRTRKSREIPKRTGGHPSTTSLAKL